jgi:sugar phosphate isomerase/epimerase
METIRKTSETGAKTIEFFPGQKLNADSDAKLDHNSSPEIFAAVKAELAKHGVRAVNYGVVGAKDEAEWRKIFELAKAFGMRAITTESVDQLDVIEKLVKEFDIAAGIHNHPRRADDPNYKVWDPNYVLSVVKDRDSRIGAAADNGHWATSGIKPDEGLRVLKGRIISMHLKDRAEIGKGTPDNIFGTGVLDLKGILDTLMKQGFDGNISIEYEQNWDNSVPDVAQCVGFFRGYATCK